MSNEKFPDTFAGDVIVTPETVSPAGQYIELNINGVDNCWTTADWPDQLVVYVTDIWYEPEPGDDSEMIAVA